MVRYSHGVAYKHRATVSLSQGSRACRQFFVLCLRCSFVRSNIKSNVGRDIRKWLRHSSSSKLLRTLDQNMDPYGFSLLHILLSEHSANWPRRRKPLRLRHFRSARLSASNHFLLLFNSSFNVFWHHKNVAWTNPQVLALCGTWWTAFLLTFADYALLAKAQQSIYLSLLLWCFLLLLLCLWAAFATPAQRVFYTSHKTATLLCYTSHPSRLLC